MKKIIPRLKFSLLVLILLSNCSQKNDSNEKHEEVSQKEGIQATYEGYLRVDLDMIILYSRRINIYNLDKSIYAQIIGDTMIVDGKKYNLIKERKDTLRHHVSSYSFDPLYKIFILKCDGLVDAYFKVQMNGGYKLISTDNMDVKFETLEEFVLSSMPSLSDKTPLRANPSDSSLIIEGYSDYEYKSTRMQGDWIFLECDQEYNDCPEGKSKGWVKWRDSTGVLIRLAQTY
jgi:serine/threonine protein phosphatase PrpC